MDSFEFTSDKPYDRHDYVLVLKDGKRYTYDSFDLVQNAWLCNCRLGNLSHIDVVDKKSSAQGFK